MQVQDGFICTPLEGEVHEHQFSCPTSWNDRNGESTESFYYMVSKTNPFRGNGKLKQKQYNIALQFPALMQVTSKVVLSHAYA
ncbi:hypothetical protein D5086_022671 [Populus alba]|uniref:Uncharacterized protein n=1 Tax=Populus alba TaxID=43335 RepID=A0ACC4BFM9_POPAL